MSDIIRIYNEKDLLEISRSDKALSGYYLLMNDIDMSSCSKEFKPIKLNKGVFDGNNKTISNLTLNHDINRKTGFFLIIGSNSIVKNLHLDSIVVKNTVSIGGCLALFNDGCIDNCVVTRAEIIGSGVFGGIVAANYGSITNCTFIGELIPEHDSGRTRYLTEAVGGICGENESEIKYCYSCLIVSKDVEDIVNDIAGINKGDISCSCHTRIVIDKHLALQHRI